MKRQIKIFMATAGISLTILGCATGPQPTQIKPITPPKKEITIKLNFPEKDPITNKDLNIFYFKNTIEKQIENNMYHLSKYSGTRVKDNNLVNSSLLKLSFGTAIQGLQINNSNNKYIFQYENTRSCYTSLAQFNLPYYYKNKNIIIAYPKTYKFTHLSSGICKLHSNTLPPLDKIDNLKKDVFNVLNNLKNTKLYISKRYILKGEINTKYPANSIYANFKRLMGQYTNYWTYSEENISPMEKENTFNLKIKKRNYPLNIKIFPYRNGSKIVYKAYISYIINSDGTSTLTRQDIENAKKEIEKVVNN